MCTMTTLALRRRGILVVDDSPDVRHLLRDGLRVFGFSFWTSATGSNAVLRYRSKRESIDAVLLDVCMPDWDGRRPSRPSGRSPPDSPAVS
jgi:CheY-like chemotaxis protein